MSKSWYFISDMHLGMPDYASSLEREKKLVHWLNEVAPKAEGIFLLGDLFDYWYEYKTVVPKGYVRILGTLAYWADQGLRIEAFTGNHDMWMFGYFEKELGIPVHKKPLEITLGNTRCLLAHGDGLGPGDRGYKFIKAVFANPICQRLFGALPPSWGTWLATFFSGRSRAAHHQNDTTYLGDDKEFIALYAQEIAAAEKYDICIFGHRHLPTEKQFGKLKMVILGDWIGHFSYGELTAGGDFKLHHY